MTDGVESKRNPLDRVPGEGIVSRTILHAILFVVSFASSVALLFVGLFVFVFVSLEKGNTGIAMPLFSFAAILAFAIGVPTARKGYYSVPLGIAAAPFYLYTRFILHWHVSL